MGGKCVGLSHFPNATISEYGEVSGADDMAKEILARGPISCVCKE
jgi:cathepsin X